MSDTDAVPGWYRLQQAIEKFDDTIGSRRGKPALDLALTMVSVFRALAAQAGEGTAPGDTNSTVAKDGESRGGNAPVALSSQAPDAESVDPTLMPGQLARPPVRTEDKAGSRDDTPPTPASEAKVPEPGSALDAIDRLPGIPGVRAASEDFILRADAQRWLTLVVRERDEARAQARYLEEECNAACEAAKERRDLAYKARTELAAVRGRMAEAIAGLEGAADKIANRDDTEYSSRDYRDLRSAVRNAVALLTDPAPEREPVWRHVKTGGLYRIMARGRIEADLTPAVIYQSIKTGDVWARPAAEFDDGRFVQEPAPERAEGASVTIREYYRPAKKGEQPVSVGVDGPMVMYRREIDPPVHWSSPEERAAIKAVCEALATLDKWPNEYSRVSDTAVRERFIPALATARTVGLPGATEETK